MLNISRCNGKISQISGHGPKVGTVALVMEARCGGGGQEEGKERIERAREEKASKQGQPKGFGAARG